MVLVAKHKVCKFGSGGSDGKDFGVWQYQFIQLSQSVLSNSLWLHELQHVRLPCPSPTTRICSNSCQLSQQCHPTISSSVIPSSPASGSFPMSQFFTSGGQSIGASVSVSILPVNVQDWMVQSPCCPRDSQESSPTSQFKSIHSLALSFLYGPACTSIHDYWKNRSFDYAEHWW